MTRRSPAAAIAAVCFALLAMPAPVSQAATLPTVPVIQWTGTHPTPAPTLAPQKPAPAPAPARQSRPVDHGLEALGGPAGLVRARAAHATATATAAATAAAVTPDITISRESVPSGQTTDVTVTVAYAGTPAANVQVQMGPYSQVTDASGNAVFQVTEYGLSIFPVQVWDQGRLYDGPNLFILAPGYAGVAISGTNVQGAPLSGFQAAAIGQQPDNLWPWTAYTGGTTAGAIVPAGDAYVELVTQGPDAYLMQTVMTMPADAVTHVRFDGAQTVPAAIAVALDGAPVGSGWVQFHSAASPWLTWFGSLWLNEAGTGVAHFTPGSYTAFVYGTSGSDGVLSPLGALNATAAGTYAFDLHRAQMEQMTFQATQGGVVQPTIIGLQSGLFSFTAPTNTATTWAAPGLYHLLAMWADLPGSTPGSTWQYSMNANGDLTVNLTAGQPQHRQWEIAATGAAVRSSAYTYQPGGGFDYRMDVQIGSDWSLNRIWDTSTWKELGQIAYTVTDAGGSTVSQGTGAYSWSYWFSVPAGPSPSYTAELQANDLGILGAQRAAATYTLETPPPPPPPVAPVSMQLDQELLTAGRANPVTMTLTKNGQPLHDAWVMVTGETAQWFKTNPHGQITAPIHPTRAGIWHFFYDSGSGQYASAYAYALAPGYGLLDAAPVDRTGQPITFFSMTAAPETDYGQGGHWGAGHVQKLVVPAGPVQLAVKGFSTQNENYYLTATVNVPSMGTATAFLDGTATVPVKLSVQNTGKDSFSQFYLRNTAMPYVEWNSLPLGLGHGGTAWVTPGRYETMIQVLEPGVRRILTPGPLTAAPGAPAVLQGDALTATSQLQLQSAGTDAHAYLSRDSIGVYVDNQDAVFLTPGTWAIDFAGFTLTGSDGLAYQYEFRGQATLTAPAAGPATLNLGGPLTAVVQPAQPAVPVKTSVPIRAAAYDANGLYLAYTQVMNPATGEYLGFVQRTLRISGLSVDTTVPVDGDTFVWDAPATAGTYTLAFTAYPAPDGAPVTGTGSVQVMR